MGLCVKKKDKAEVKSSFGVRVPAFYFCLIYLA